MRLPCLLAFLLSLAAFLSGCQTGEILAVVPISDGGKINVPLTSKGPPQGEGGGYRVELAMVFPGKENRQAYYQFGMSATAKAPALQRLRIEDISDEKPALLLDEANPKFEKNSWMGKTDIIAAEDRRMAWLFQITSSMRVYRFTLTTTAGETITFNHVSIYPPMIKESMRAKWGEKY
ncbi:hypothetical protein [Opitutus sp. ER46]|uniref:hypothetical protein n=1 Tax=Opitutus sp. ER46 TaxID=2161864 RepID=UPI000D316091|nr:hypothetical protein [Opitutus sp. ER46]PTX90935.1 hypothetical protein DB354_20000 [Opitutus sp. ER46]